MVKLAEPTKVCSKCKRRKVWSQFYAKRKWPNGTTRQPQSWCKLCQSGTPRRPENRRRTNARYWAKYKVDPALYEDHLERRRFRYHIARGTVDRPGRTAGMLLAPEPFAAWFRGVMKRDGLSIEDTADRLGIAEKTARRVLAGHAVQLDTVERALIADDTAALRDVYPSLYSEAA